MFFEIFSKLCQKCGEAPNAVARKLEIASGTVSEWKKGRTPKNSTLKKIADYFGVSVGYLLGKAEVKTAEFELEENTVMYRYDGKNYVKHFTREQMDTLRIVIEAIPEIK